jgi:MFS family permease
VVSRRFAALEYRPYRIYLFGQSLANMGTWMQNVAQEWLALALTHSPTAVGITMALQFSPILLFGVHGGLLADRCSTRRLLLITQLANAVLTTLLAVLSLAGALHPSELYIFALLTGFVFVVDAPARQVFITEVVRDENLRGAISLNGAVLQATRMIGPAIAGVLIATIGTGWVFAVNALCYAGPTVSLLLLRPRDLIARPAVSATDNRGLRHTVGYAFHHPRIGWTILLVGLVGTFGLNFPIVLTAMAQEDFHGTASTYASFNMALAVGSALGALLAGYFNRADVRFSVLTALAFGACQLAAAAAPTLATFWACLACMGLMNLAFQSVANTSIHVWTDTETRGRVMGLYMLAFTGGTPLGALTIGAVTSHLGARVGMGVCGGVPALAAIAIGLLNRRTDANQASRAVIHEGRDPGLSADLADLAGHAGTPDVPGRETRQPREVSRSR